MSQSPINSGDIQRYRAVRRGERPVYCLNPLLIAGTFRVFMLFDNKDVLESYVSIPY